MQHTAIGRDACNTPYRNAVHARKHCQGQRLRAWAKRLVTAGCPGLVSPLTSYHRLLRHHRHHHCCLHGHTLGFLFFVCGAQVTYLLQVIHTQLQVEIMFLQTCHLTGLVTPTQHGAPSAVRGVPTSQGRRWRICWGRRTVGTTGAAPRIAGAEAVTHGEGATTGPRSRWELHCPVLGEAAASRDFGISLKSTN